MYRHHPQPFWKLFQSLPTSSAWEEDDCDVNCSSHAGYAFLTASDYHYFFASLFLYFNLLVFLTASFSLKPFGIKNQLPERTESNRWSDYRTSQTQKKLFNLNDLATRGVQTIVFSLTRDMKSFYGFGNGCLTNVSVSESPLIRKQFSVLLNYCFYLYLQIMD